jgi:hypothetical protein
MLVSLQIISQNFRILMFKCVLNTMKLESKLIKARIVRALPE